MNLLEKYNIPIEEESYFSRIDRRNAREREISDKMSIDPIVIRELISKYEILKDLNMVASYANTRKWSPYMAIRDLLQNAMDEEEEYYNDYEKVKDVKIYIDKYGMHIRDHGRGISHDAFIIGKSDKKCWQRGKFGEGLNVSVASLLLHNCNIYFFVKNIVYKPVVVLIDNKTKLRIYLLFGESNINLKNGTDVVIYHPDKTILKELYDDIKRVTFQSFISKKTNKIIAKAKLFTEECKKTRTASIVASGKKLLFVADIYVNTLENITNLNPLYTYNTWFLDLNTNRNNVVVTSDLYHNLAFLYESASMSGKFPMSDFIKLIFDVSGTDGGVGKILTTKNYLMELHIKWDHADTFKKLFVQELKKMFPEHKVCGFAKTPNPNIESILKYQLEDYVTIVDTNNSDLFICGKPKDRWYKYVDEILQEQSINRRKEQKTYRVKYEDLLVYQAINLAKAYIIYEIFVMDEPLKEIIVSEKLGNAMGMYDPSSGYIGIRLIDLGSSHRAKEIIFEETAHKLGYELLKTKAEDQSKHLEKAMNYLASEMVTKATKMHDQQESIFHGFIIPYENSEWVKRFNSFYSNSYELNNIKRSACVSIVDELMGKYKYKYKPSKKSRAPLNAYMFVLSIEKNFDKSLTAFATKFSFFVITVKISKYENKYISSVNLISDYKQSKFSNRITIDTYSRMAVKDFLEMIPRIAESIHEYAVNKYLTDNTIIMTLLYDYEYMKFKCYRTTGA